MDDKELRDILDTLAYKHSCEGYIKNGDPHDVGVMPDEIDKALQAIEKHYAQKMVEAKLQEWDEFGEVEFEDVPLDMINWVAKHKYELNQLKKESL